MHIRILSIKDIPSHPLQTLINFSSERTGSSSSLMLSVLLKNKRLQFIGHCRQCELSDQQLQSNIILAEERGTITDGAQPEATSFHFCWQKAKSSLNHIFITSNKMNYNIVFICYIIFSSDQQYSYHWWILRNNTSTTSKHYSNELNHFFETIVPNALRLSFATERLALQTYALQKSKHYTTILSETTPLSRSTGAQERAPMLLYCWSFTSFLKAEQEDCSSSAGSEATVTQSAGDSTMLSISSARLQDVSDMAKVSQKWR